MSKNDDSLFTIQPSDWADFSLQLSKETDRGSTLVGTSFLENRLGALIESFLLEKPKLIKKLLKGPLAPLSTFYSRTLAAYLLGLISEDEKNDLDIIRSIRNDFAHSHKALDFSSPTISSKISKLRVPLLVPSNVNNAGSTTPKQSFIDTVSMISTFLDIRRESLKDKREPAKSFHIDP